MKSDDNLNYAIERLKVRKHYRIKYIVIGFNVLVIVLF